MARKRQHPADSLYRRDKELLSAIGVLSFNRDPLMLPGLGEAGAVRALMTFPAVPGLARSRRG
jgi:hypothetical protein